MFTAIRTVFRDLRDLGCLETGGIAITPVPSDKMAVIKPGQPMRAFFGIEPAILDEKVCESNSDIAAVALKASYECDVIFLAVFVGMKELKLFAITVH